MNINKESYASLTPSIDIQRSRFEQNHSLFSSGNLGQLLPIECVEVLPGDTWDYKTNAVVRLQPLVAPIMDDIRADIFWFFCPMRILWNHTKEFFGENTAGPWAPEVEYHIPQIRFVPKNTDDPIYEGEHYIELGPQSGSVGDYLGLPCLRLKIDNYRQPENRDPRDTYYYPPGGTDINDLVYEVNHLPFRAYASVVNEFFRSEALQNPVNIYLGDDTQYAVTSDINNDSDTDYVNKLQLSGKPFVACKLFDIFTGALPSAQRAAEPVMALPNSYVYFGDARPASEVFENHDPAQNYISSNSMNIGVIQPYYSSNAQWVTSPKSQPNNWMIDGVSVEQIRVAFQVQKFYEATARSGGRYRSILESLFHVHASDQSMQVPQFLGSQSFYLNINQVIQTSETGNTPQGNPAGMSVTSHSGHDFIQSFTEHGYIIGLMTTRYHHTYQQALDGMWNVKDKFDLYWPQFANVGEQPVLRKNVCMTGVPITDEEVFGYQEAYARYRYKFNSVTGEMRSNVLNSMDMYHLADWYQSKPLLGDSWIMEDCTNLDRCLATTSTVANQFWFNLYFDVNVTRAMPVHSIPGLVDHH